MKKMIAVLLTVCVAAIMSPVSFADGGFNFEMPEMPEMPTFDTSSWGEFTAPEGWGDMDLGNFSSPINGGSWGDLGGSDWGSDWGASFEEMKKSMESSFNTSKDQNGQPSDWPPSSFKDLEDAFNQQKNSIGENENSGEQESLQDLFKNKFGDVGNDQDYSEIPSLDFAQNALTQNQELETPTGKYLQIDSSSIANLNTIQSFISNTSSKIDENVSFDSLSDMPSLGANIGGADVKSSYNTIAGSLSPKFDYTKKYNGSLFEKAK